MSLAVKPTTRSPLTVPACLPSRLTCQTHGECCASVMPLLRGGCIMANSIRWSLIEGHGPPRVGSGKWKSRRRQGLGGRGNSEATPEAPPLSSKFGYSLGGSTRVLGRGATPAGPDPPSSADDTGPRCSALQQWRTAHHRPWPSATPGSGPANPSKTGRNGVGTTGRGQSGVQGTPLIFRQPTQDCGVLPGLVYGAPSASRRV